MFLPQNVQLATLSISTRGYYEDELSRKIVKSDEAPKNIHGFNLCFHLLLKFQENVGRSA